MKMNRAAGRILGVICAFALIAAPSAGLLPAVGGHAAALPWGISDISTPEAFRLALADPDINTIQLRAYCYFGVLLLKYYGSLLKGMMIMTILVVDAQGGGLGRALIEKLIRSGVDAEIIGVGTNSLASSALLKAGASAVATGENAVVHNAARADIIAGGIGIVCANAMLGEITPAMASAISGSEAIKVLIPLNRCKIQVCGVTDQPLPVKLDYAVSDITSLIDEIKIGAVSRY
ncbi:hypothetical protein FACS1894191_8900 [Clostridia bacterium]|nr:hypothetical protein FACS1894191_8900 [Clostridia bacterium]